MNKDTFAPWCLRLNLSHGDFVVMHGAKIQPGLHEMLLSGYIAHSSSTKPRLIESRLEGNGKLAAGGYGPYPSAAYLFVLYREIFGITSGSGPEPLSAEEAAIPIKLGHYITDREVVAGWKDTDG